MTEELLRVMWLIRAFEERVGRLKRADEIPGLVHVSLGQEAVAAGVCTQLRDDEAVYSGHRAHGHALAKGCAPERVMAELMGRADGLCGGLGGSMHLVDAARGFMGATGVVGGTIPLALGHTLTGRVAVVFFGDGAVQAGHFNESVNLAALWGAPLILVCENNGFAEFTPRSAHTVVERVSDVVAPYAFVRKTVDGNDVLAVHEAFGAFLAAARAGRGPFLLECLTTRLSGHYEGDPHHRRDPDAVDPIARLDSDPALEAEARERVEAAVEFARASPWPTSAPVYA